MVYALKPGSLHPLRERYCQTLNILLRKELRICTSGVRKTIMATSQAAANSDTIKAEGKHVRQGISGHVPEATQLVAVFLGRRAACSLMSLRPTCCNRWPHALLVGEHACWLETPAQPACRQICKV